MDFALILLKTGNTYPDYVIGIIIAVLIMAYLIYTMIKPEKF